MEILGVGRGRSEDGQKSEYNRGSDMESKQGCGTKSRLFVLTKCSACEKVTQYNQTNRK